MSLPIPPCHSLSCSSLPCLTVIPCPSYPSEQRREELARRDGTLAECTKRSQKLAHEAWALTRSASVLWVPGVCSDYKKTKKFAKEWYRFIDPDTMNVFWYRRLVSLLTHPLNTPS